MLPPVWALDNQGSQVLTMEGSSSPTPRPVEGSEVTTVLGNDFGGYTSRCGRVVCVPEDRQQGAVPQFVDEET
jgi:hypothetical protein